MIIPCLKTWLAPEVLLLTNICLYFLSNCPVERFGKYITLFLLLAFSCVCCMVDTTSLGCFPIMTEIVFFLRQQQSNGRLMLYDTSVHQANLSPSLLFLIGTAVSKQSHYTTLQGLPLYLCNVFCFSLLHDLGLLVTFQNLLSSLQTRRDVPSNLFFSFTVPILFAENFHAFEGCNHVASWSLFLSLNNYSPFNLPLLTLDHAFCSPPDILQSLHMFLDSGTQNLIQALIWASLLFICLPSWQILGQVMTLVFNSWHLKH